MRNTLHLEIGSYILPDRRYMDMSKHRPMIITSKPFNFHSFSLHYTNSRCAFYTPIISNFRSSATLLLFDRLHALPSPFQFLFEQPDPVVARAHRQHIPAETPACPPRYGIEIQRCRLPFPSSVGRGRRPNSNGLVLGGRSDIELGEDRG